MLVGEIFLALHHSLPARRDLYRFSSLREDKLGLYFVVDNLIHRHHNGRAIAVDTPLKPLRQSPVAE